MKKEIKDIKDILGFNENEFTAYLWDTKKAALRGKFTALSAYIKKLEMPYYWTKTLPESSRTKRSKHTQEEEKVENNQSQLKSIKWKQKGQYKE